MIPINKTISISWMFFLLLNAEVVGLEGGRWEIQVLLEQIIPLVILFVWKFVIHYKDWLKDMGESRERLSPKKMAKSKLPFFFETMLDENFGVSEII